MLGILLKDQKFLEVHLFDGEQLHTERMCMQGHFHLLPGAVICLLCLMYGDMETTSQFPSTWNHNDQKSCSRSHQVMPVPIGSLNIVHRWVQSRRQNRSPLFLPHGETQEAK